MKPRVLIVEDVHGALYERAIAKRSDAIYRAETLTDAFTLLETEAINLVFCDLELPDGTSLGFVRTCYYRGVPVVALSADDGYQHPCEEIGVFGFFVKPVSIKTLVCLVDDYVALRGTCGTSASG